MAPKCEKIDKFSSSVKQLGYNRTLFREIENLIVKNQIYFPFFCIFYDRSKSKKQSPFEKWQIIQNINFRSMKFVGCQFMDDNYKVYANTLFAIFSQLNYDILLIYSLYIYRMIAFKALITTPMLGFYVPVG